MQRTQPSPASGRDHIAQWQDLKFGMFIHWGIYSVAGGVWDGQPIEGYNEQIMHRAKIPAEEYAQLASEFTAERFDPDAIARLAKETGMRYVVLTAKHHDGFNLYHTRLSPFNIADASPFGRDAVKELADACARQDIRFGVYYSLIDWTYPGATPMSDHNSDPITPALEDYTVGQLRELLTGYGPLCEVWFDMSHPTLEQSMQFANLVHELQPGCMVSGRVFNGQQDFLVCGDNEVPDHWFAGAWETPVTVFHETWGYRSWQERTDLEGKIREKVRDLAFVTARGGNLLLNIGPRGDGSVVEYEADVLRGLGQWLKHNGESVFGAAPEPHLRLDFGYATSRPGRVYLFVTEVPDSGRLRIPGWQAPIVQVKSLGDSERLDWDLADDSLHVMLSEGREDAYLTVIAVDYSDELPPFLPTDAILADGDQTVRLIPSEGLAWHQAIGHDYYSQQKIVVAREWVVFAAEDTSWNVSVNRTQPGESAGYLLTTGDSWTQFILPSTESPTVTQAATISLKGEQISLVRLESIAPNQALDDAGIEITLEPC